MRHPKLVRIDRYHSSDYIAIPSVRRRRSEESSTSRQAVQARALPIRDSRSYVICSAAPPRCRCVVVAIISSSLATIVPDQSIYTYLPESSRRTSFLEQPADHIFCRPKLPELRDSIMSHAAQQQQSSSPVLSPITPSAYGTAPASVFTSLTTNPELVVVNDTITMMKASLGNLGVRLMFSHSCRAANDQELTVYHSMCLTL